MPMDVEGIKHAIAASDCLQDKAISVVALDQVPRIVRNYPSAFIINTSYSQDPGFHWVAVWFSEMGDAEFFDSYGYHPSKYTLERFVYNNACKCTYNTQAWQNEESVVCGQYCLFVLTQKFRGVDFDDIRKQFGLNQVENDLKVISSIGNATSGGGQTSCSLKEQQTAKKENLQHKKKSVTFSDSVQVHQLQDEDYNRSDCPWLRIARRQYKLRRHLALAPTRKLRDMPKY